MRFVKVVSVLTVFLFAVSLLSLAKPNQFGVADAAKVTFSEPIRLGDVLLPKGEYQVEHTMQGQDHIMVFTQLKASSPVTARVKCQLVPLQQKAARTEILYTHDKNNVHVLQELIFAGDTAKHVF